MWPKIILSPRPSICPHAFVIKRPKFETRILLIWSTQLLSFKLVLWFFGLNLLPLVRSIIDIGIILAPDSAYIFRIYFCSYEKKNFLKSLSVSWKVTWKFDHYGSPLIELPIKQLVIFRPTFRENGSKTNIYRNPILIGLSKLSYKNCHLFINTCQVLPEDVFLVLMKNAKIILIFAYKRTTICSIIIELCS